jgi:hypothetical protein
MSCKCNCNQNNQAIDIIGLCDPTSVTIVTGESWTEISIPEVLKIPCEKPDIENIDKIFINVKIISKRVIKTPNSNGTPNAEGTLLTGRKLIIEGVLNQKIVYTADVPEQSVHSAHFQVPFSAYIVIPADTELYDKFCVKTCIEDVYTEVFSKRGIFKNVTLLLKAEKIVGPITPCP